MPRIKSPPVARRTATPDEEDEEYEESFESMNSPPKAAAVVSPTKKTMSPAGQQTSEDTVVVEGMDLETFMSSKGKGGDESRASQSNDPSLRPLEGVSPNKNSADQALGLRFGAYEEFEDGVNPPHSETSSSKKPKKKAAFRLPPGEEDEELDEEEEDFRKRRAEFLLQQKQEEEHPAPKSSLTKKVQIVAPSSQVGQKGPITAAQYAYYASLLNKKGGDGEFDQTAAAAASMPSDEDSARRVDALLNELLPHRNAKAVVFGSQQQVQGGSKAKGQQRRMKQQVAEPPSGHHQHSSQQFGLGAIGPRRSLADGDEFEGSMTETRLENQIASLKKEMRARDDRLSRLTENSMALSNHCDQLKSEVSQLQQKLRTAELELEAKEQRASDAARLRKKAMKKSARLVAEMENYDVLVQTCERLQTREQALLEAVEALSTQNEDLIKKLKSSMARELELTQRQSKMVQRGAITDPDQPLSPRSPPRAQSDTRLQRPPHHQKRASKGGLLPDVNGGQGSRYR